MELVCALSLSTCISSYFWIWLFCRSLAVGSKSGYKFFSLSSVDKLEQIYECSKCLLYFSPFLKKKKKTQVTIELKCILKLDTVIQAQMPLHPYSSFTLVYWEVTTERFVSVLPGLFVYFHTYKCTYRNTCLMGGFFLIHSIILCLLFCDFSPFSMPFKPFRFPS